MQPNLENKNVLGNIFEKEFNVFFRAPTAWLFLAAFLLVTLYVFFWVESFFSRNIADVRPLFEWMPILLIFLSAALTMKMWSEERRSGTLEHVLTQPVSLWQFVAGKFLACLALLSIALLLTFPLAVTVALLGDLDWGPVFSGYIAALLLGAAYLSMGLFVSSRCDNQIVSLLLTVALAGAFYILGSDLLTGLVNQQSAELLRGLGTGSRFDSITRGVLDFRDLYYYLSLIVVFIALNVFSLERGRWAADGDKNYHRAWQLVTGLVLANVLLANVWLVNMSSLRWDVTEGKMYSISATTQDYLQQLQEPMLIRAYFSQKTHPLLAPLVPQLQDLLREYEVAGGGQVRVEVLDPTSDPQLEDEANNRFGILPTPFRVNDRHQAALVNSYFDVLIQYGDEHQVLNFGDLIEVKSQGEGDIEVQLRNPEYDITRAIKQALVTYQTGGDVFAAIDEPVQLTAYISATAKLPAQLQELRRDIEREVSQLQSQAGAKLRVEFVDPDANAGEVGKQITERYGFAPMAASLMDAQRFYFYITLGQGEQLLQVPLEDFTAEAFSRNLNAGLKRFAEGFTRTVALVAPERLDPHLAMQLGQQPNQGVPSFTGLRQILGESMNVLTEDLSDGAVSPTADILFLAAPKLTSEQERFAVDQFLMRGGTVIASTSPYSASLTRSNLTLQRYNSGLEDWLAAMGVSLGEQLVLDEQNSAFPVPTVREVAGMRFQEMRMIDYPYFLDVRGTGLNSNSPMTAGLPQVTVPWASPIELRDNLLAELEVTELLHSSTSAWLGDAAQAMPSVAELNRGYAIAGEQARHLVGVALRGRFTSSFAGKDSPLLAAAEQTASNDAAESEQSPALHPVLNRSPESARLLVFASNDLFRDQIVNMLGSVSGAAYLHSLQLAVNAVESSLADEGLLRIRSRGHFNRTLTPMSKNSQLFWEYLNYGLAMAGLALLALLMQLGQRARLARYQQWLKA